VSYADAQVGKLLDRLDALELADSTIVVLWGDHGWHLGEHAIWGKHALFEESLRSPLIVRHLGIANPGAKTNAVVESLDVFPTLCELAGLKTPDFASGTSLSPLLKSVGAGGHDAVSYGRGASTIRSETHRLIVHKKGELELYDHRVADAETKNIAATHPDLVKALRARLNAKLKP
jgi:iduronate 2-sulfatase